MAEPTAPPTSAGAPAPAFRGTNEIKPLPFDPSKLRGLSEKLLKSHHENNYGGAVKRLNLIQQQIASIPKDAAPYQLGSLKREELIATNSMILHEFYFGNLGGSGKADGGVRKALERTYGSFGRFEELVKATGASLGGGSGWVVLDRNLHNGELRIYAAINHTQAVAFGQPLLVLDMFEHAYQMDFGAAAAKYIDAYWQVVNWDAVNARFERSEGHAFDVLERAHDESAVGRPRRRDSEAAVAHDDRGHAVPR